MVEGCSASIAEAKPNSDSPIASAQYPPSPSNKPPTAPPPAAPRLKIEPCNVIVVPIPAGDSAVNGERRGGVDTVPDRTVDGASIGVETMDTLGYLALLRT